MHTQGQLSWAAKMGRVVVFSVFAFVCALAVASAAQASHPKSPSIEHLDSDVVLPAVLLDLASRAGSAPPAAGFYDLQAQDIDGMEMKMSQFAGDVLYVCFHVRVCVPFTHVCGITNSQTPGHIHAFDHDHASV